MIFGESRIGTKSLAALCRRMSMSLSAGIDVRTVMAREATNARGAVKRKLEEVRVAVAQGSSLHEAIDRTGNLFPEFFREMVRVGETTGNLPEVFRQLAEHYEHQLSMRRTFISSITFPLIELCLALTVVGVLIYVMGAVPQLKASGIDFLGFGLSGSSGLTVYLMFLGAIAAAGFAVYQASVRGLLWVAPLQKAVMHIPRLGKALETMALARLSWAMHVTLNTGMDLRTAMKMSLNSTQNALYTQHVDDVMSSIRAGHEIHESLAATQTFPVYFLDAVRVGEESGQLVESMGHLSRQYQEESRLAMSTLAVLMGVLVALLVMAIIAFFIFRIAGKYTDILNDAAKGKF